MKDIKKIKSLRLLKRSFSPRDLEASSHADSCRASSQRINRCVRKKHAVHSERRSRSDYRADIGGVYDIHQYSDALFVFAEFLHRHLRSSSECHPKAAHQSVARKLRYDIAPSNIDWHRFEFFLAAILLDALENRPRLSFQPFLLNEHRQRLVSCFDRTHDDIRGLCKEYAYLRLKICSELRLCYPGKHIQFRSVDVCNFYIVHAYTVSSG